MGTALRKNSLKMSPTLKYCMASQVANSISMVSSEVSLLPVALSPCRRAHRCNARLFSTLSHPWAFLPLVLKSLEATPPHSVEEAREENATPRDKCRHFCSPSGLVLPSLKTFLQAQDFRLHHRSQARIQVLANGTAGTRFQNRPQSRSFCLNKYSVTIQKRKPCSHWLSQANNSTFLGTANGSSRRKTGRDAQGESESERNGQKPAASC